jgi:hypothetical protein
MAETAEIHRSPLVALSGVSKVFEETGTRIELFREHLGVPSPR